MSNLLLFAWECAVVLGVFGAGIALLRAIGLKNGPPAIAGTTGISVWIALGGYLNAVHGIRTGLLVPATIVAAVVGAYFLIGGSSGWISAFSSPEWMRFRGSNGIWLLRAALVLIGLLALGGTHKSWWCIDDLEGYMAMARKTLQNHAIQPDFFCERRVQAGVGGQNFLESWMLAPGDMRATAFIDSAFGVLLYAGCVWTFCRRWGLSLPKASFVLLCLPFATLVKVNLTIIYLSAASFFAVLLLLTELFEEERLKVGTAVVLGLIVGAASTTKTPNLTLLLPLVIGSALLSWVLAPRLRIVQLLLVLFAVAGLVFIPYSLQNKVTAGTYLYPLLGNGIHVSAYGLIPVPSKAGSLGQVLALVVPIALLFACAGLCMWRLTARWTVAQRAATLSFLAAVMLATAASIYGLGASGADRYTAPFVATGFLVCLTSLLATTHLSRDRTWRLCAFCVLLLGLYTSVVVGVTLKWYRDYRTVGLEAFGVRDRHPSGYQRYFSERDLREGAAYGEAIQSSMPRGATAIVDASASYVFDYSRNRIFIQDMAEWQVRSRAFRSQEAWTTTDGFCLSMGLTTSFSTAR